MHYQGEFREFPQDKMWLTPDEYLRKANGTEPIRSSIPDAIRGAAQAAKSARNINVFGALAGLIALAAVVVGGYQVVTSTLSLVSETSENLARIESNQKELKSKMLSTLSANDQTDETIHALRTAIDALEASIDRLVDEGTGSNARIKALEERGIDKQGEQQ